MPGDPYLEMSAGFDEHVHQLACLARPDARQKRKQPSTRNDVERIFGQPQERHQVLDVGRFDEL